MELTGLVLLFQAFFAIAGGLYFLSQYRSRKDNRDAIAKESARELRKLQRLRSCRLSEPLSEKTRPRRFEDIIGQEDGVKALKAALCGPNPQHVIIYGPPGIGKTCAARLVLEQAKKTPGSPFAPDAKFIEIDATCVRFDERSVADPLIGSVHDPIYQGAGAMGAAGIPQPKPGAVTKANGGILFLDEIGELHPLQMNKLLKVLEDRKVMFESAYYSSDDHNIPDHIHDIFKHGLPADFRLVGATTRQPGEISPAIRSRCLEIFFRALKPAELQRIAAGAAQRSGMDIDNGATALCAHYAENGRDIVNMVQLASGISYEAGKSRIAREEIEWVAQTCRYRARLDKKVPTAPQAGCANGLAVTGDGQGVLLEIEALATRTAAGQGTLKITGLVEEEEFGSKERRYRRKGTAAASVENVLTALRNSMLLDVRDYDLHINIPGGAPVDGPSAGTAIAVAVASALTGVCADHRTAMTGEISIRGDIKPVGGIRAKIEAAAQAGATAVLIPAENYPEAPADCPIAVIPVKDIEALFKKAFAAETPTTVQHKEHLLIAEGRG